jgi:protein-L-isoaspartate(D-aspartate) O-methyltransferase
VALPIGSGQTISQPLVVARMCELLELSDEDRVLDVGTGSGYHAAVLARLVRHVWTVERHPGLSERAAVSLAAAGVENVTLLVGDGRARPTPRARPTTRSSVAAAMGRLPEALAGQLAPGGRLVGPVDDGDQRLIRLRRTAGRRARALRATSACGRAADQRTGLSLGFGRCSRAPTLRARAPVDEHDVGGEVVGAADQRRAHAVGVDRHARGLEGAECGRR